MEVCAANQTPRRRRTTSSGHAKQPQGEAKKPLCLSFALLEPPNVPCGAILTPIETTFFSIRLGAPKAGTTRQHRLQAKETGEKTLRRPSPIQHEAKAVAVQHRLTRPGRKKRSPSPMQPPIRRGSEVHRNECNNARDRLAKMAVPILRFQVGMRHLGRIKILHAGIAMPIRASA